MSLNIFDKLQELGDAMPESPVADDGSGPRKRHSGGLHKPLIWVDLEMSGLSPERDCILQIAVIITDGSLDREIEGPELVIHQPESVLESMGEWCQEHHASSGLVKAVRESALDVTAAETLVMEFILRHVPASGMAALAGSSIHVDRAFLSRYMPRIVAHCSHRLVDVSSIDELAWRWNTRVSSAKPRSKGTHTAMADIRDSLELLRYYKKSFFAKPKKRVP